MPSAIKAYWWRRLKNFGDAINPDILSYMSGRPVEYVEPRVADIICIGSIINNADETTRDDPVYVWGAGALNPNLKMEKPNLVYAAVRGPLTADLLDATSAVFGDPGLLIADIVPRRAPNGKVGIVLHHSKKPSPWLQDLVKSRDDEFEIIYAVNDDHLEVVRKISACSHIFSSSLHGLVVADAYHIPNTWLDPRGNHGFPRFKFRDYAAGVGRFFDMPMRFEDLVDHLKAFKPSGDVVSYAQNVEQTKTNLRNSFPSALKA